MVYIARNIQSAESPHARWEELRNMTLFDFSCRLGCAVAFGFLIGLERQLTRRVAGVHTNILVSMGACLFSMFSQLMGAPDTTRIAAQVVTGIGFLCSGIIFKEGLNVRGLTTATTIWCTAAIGVLCSGGFLLFATVASVMLIAGNLIFPFIVSRIQPLTRVEDEESAYILSVSCREEDELHVRSVIMDGLSNTRLHLINLQSADEVGGQMEIKATVQVGGRQRDEQVERLTMQVARERGVTKAGWKMA